jgi:hypothetical protein
MADHGEAAQGAGFRDRKTALVVFGVFEVILGALCAVIIPFMIFGTIASAALDKSPAGPVSLRMVIPGVLFYAVAAAWFIWLGIGSIKARRWARALLLVSSWIWLVAGIFGFILMLVMMPGMYERMGQEGQIPEEMAAVMKYVMLGFMGVIYVVIPGALVLFYGSRNVKATCESRDPRVRWTDKCPLRVLALSLMYAYGAGSALLMGFYGWTIPFFGFILSGFGGAVAALVATALCVYVAWGTYRLRMKAWWCAMLLTVAGAASTAITFSRVSLWDFYEKMNFPEQQLEMMRQYGMPHSSTMALFSGVWLLGFLGYLLYTRRYFTSSPIQSSAS